MSASTAKPKRRAKSRVLGAEAFASISAVEGLHLNPTSRKRLEALKSSPLNREQRRTEVLRAYKDAKRLG